MRRKHVFVPDALGRLEDRLVLSTGVAFVRGAAVLTNHALNKTVSDINAAFRRFATKGLDYARLESGLKAAVSRIPYNRVDGLYSGMRDVVSQLKADIADGVPNPVIAARQAVLASLRDAVASRVSDGSVLRR